MTQQKLYFLVVTAGQPAYWSSKLWWESTDVSHCFPVISQTACNHGDRDNISKMCVCLFWELIAIQHEYIDNIFCFVCQSYIITILHSRLSSTIICGTSAMRAGLRHFVSHPLCCSAQMIKEAVCDYLQKWIIWECSDLAALLTGWQALKYPYINIIKQH